MNSNGIHPCLRLPSMALMENGDAPMVSAMTLSQKSSASTVPGNDNEMEDLIHKLSSSSLRNDINPFAEFLDIPLSAVLTGGYWFLLCSIPNCFLFIISAIAGVLLKSQHVYYFSVKIFRTILNNSDICSAVTVSVRIKFLKLPTTFQYSCNGTSEW